MQAGGSVPFGSVPQGRPLEQPRRLELQLRKSRNRQVLQRRYTMGEGHKRTYKAEPDFNHAFGWGQAWQTLLLTDLLLSRQYS